MNGIDDTGLFFKGIGEGFAAPLIEGLVAYLIVQFGIASQPIINQTHTVSIGIPFTFSDLLIWFTAMILIEHIIMGLIGRISMAAGYCLGAVFAIFCYASIVSNIFPNMVSEIWGIIAIIVIGMVVRGGISYLIGREKNQNEDLESY